MGSNWRIYSLGDLIDVKHGFAFKGEYMRDDIEHGPIVVAIGNFDYNGGFRFSETKLKRYTSDYPESFTLQAGDMLLAMTCQTSGGEILGIPGIIPDDGHVYLHNQRLGKIVIREPKLVCLEYLYWLFLSQDFNQFIFQRATGTKILHTSPTKILEYQTHLPPLAEQKKIARQLWQLQNKTILNRQINQTLEQMAQALFKSWFVDFDPVVDNALDAGFFEQNLAFSDELLRRAEARKAVREHTDFKPLPKATRQLFPAAFEECSEPFLGLGGWLPQGWKIAMLDEITCELRRGVSPKYVEEGGVQVINQKCIRNHEVSYEPARRHNHEAKKIDGRELCIGDVLVNSTGVGTLGRIAQVTHLPETTVVDSHVTVVRVKDDVCPIYTFGQLMLSMEGKIEQLGEGSTGQTELSRKILSEQLVILPPSDIAGQVEKTFKSFSEKQVSNRKQCSTLTNLRDTLLPKLISGELRLDQIEADLAKEGMA
ncbi:restriction endonuclease subunit S [Aeromonas caviae]|uniref:restriction endonuclease subunit S n=1 Tax=Aeromonas caviae TaxID=648 RepID=UPI002B49743E|nr:restriction endonuclease subunit S [Aeromonas caviae]